MQLFSKRNKPVPQIEIPKRDPIPTPKQDTAPAIKKQITDKIIYAFTSGGIEYFQFEDFNNMPPMRSMKTMVFYEEMRMKCTLEYLQLHTKAMDNILLSEKINIYEIKKLNDQLKQRLFIALDTELIYKLASVVYFDKNEDTTDYDFTYNAKKVQHWKKSEGHGFFLQKHITELLPVLKDLGQNLVSYSKVVESMNEKHLEDLLPNLPQNVREKLRNSSYFNAVVMPQK